MFTFAGRCYTLEKILWKNSQPNRDLPVITDTKVDHIEGSLQITFYATTVNCHLNMRLDD